MDPDVITVTCAGRTVRLSPGAWLVLGRGGEAGLVVRGPLVSRRHLLVSHRDGWYVEDLASSNGSFVDGRRISHLPVTHDTVIRLGDPDQGVPVELRVTRSAATPGGLPPVPAAARGTSAPAGAPRMPAPAAMARPPRPAAQQRRPGPPPRPAAPAATSADLLIGRSPACQVQVPDLFTSLTHARVRVGAGTAPEVQRLGGDPVYLNGIPVDRAPLHQGDLLTVGTSDFTVSSERMIPASEMYPGRPGLEVEHIGFTIRGGRRLLDDVDFSAPRGSLTAVIGPSGAGKSTLARALSGLTRVSAGRVSFDGFDVHRQYAIAKRRIGLVPQDDVIHRRLRLRQALAYAARLRLDGDVTAEERQRQIDRAVDQLDLRAHLDTRIDRLSGGQRKRASVAMELLTEPSLLILDEPTSGLDPALDRQLMQEFRELADGGRTVLVITHSVACLDTCDQIVVLVPGGAPAFIGSPAQAARFFGTADWSRIFDRLKDHPEECRERWRRHAPALRHGSPPATETREPRAHGRWLRQTLTLIRRQVALLRADRGYSLFLLAVPFLVGLLPIVVPGDVGLTQVQGAKNATEPQLVLTLLVIGASFLGIAMTIRDLVSERTIFLRERAVSLSTTAYLASKVVVYGVLGWLGAIVIVLMAGVVKPPPTGPGVLGLGERVELVIALGVTITVSLMLGLLLSALVGSQSQVMPVIIVVFLVQLVMNGGLVPLADSAALDAVSRAVPTRWTMAMGAISIDLPQLLTIADEQERAAVAASLPETDPLWEQDLQRWWQSLGIATGMGVASLVWAWARLRRQHV